MADAPESMRITSELRLAGGGRPVGGGLCYGGFAAVQRCGPSFIQTAGDWASAKQDGVVPEDCHGSDWAICLYAVTTCTCDNMFFS